MTQQARSDVGTTSFQVEACHRIIIVPEDILLFVGKQGNDQCMTPMTSTLLYLYKLTPR